MDKVLVVGLGNPILGDDGVGWQVAVELQKQKALPAGLEIDCLGLGGLSLMERLIGYQRVILVDAIVSSQHEIGSVYSFDLDQLPDHFAGHSASPHDTSLQNAIQMGRAIGAQLPNRVQVVAVEACQVYDFSEELSPLVAAAVPKAVQRVLELLNE